MTRGRSGLPHQHTRYPILTQPASDPVSAVHHRMSVILPATAYTMWLSRQEDIKYLSSINNGTNALFDLSYFCKQGEVCFGSRRRFLPI